MKLKILLSLITLSCLSQMAQADHGHRRGICEGRLNGADTNMTEEEKRDLERRCSEARMARARIEVSAVGVDERDCVSQVRHRAQMKSHIAIHQCNSQANGLYYCHITRERITQYPTSIRAIYASGFFDERKSDEATCRSSSIRRAEKNALENCQEELGVLCNITSAGNVLSYKTEKRRRYIIAGPKELYHICRAQAAAEPPAQYRYKCSMEVEASVIR